MNFLNVGENGADDEEPATQTFFKMFSWSTFLSCFCFTLFWKYGSNFFLSPIPTIDILAGTSLLELRE